MMRERLFPPPPQETGRAGSLLLSLVLVLLGTLATAAAAEFQVNTHTTKDQLAPAVAVDALGNFVVVWEAYYQDGSRNGVFARRYNSTGTALGDEFQVNTYTRGNQESPSVAAHGDGDFVVVWTGYGEGDDDYPGGVFGQRFDSSGSARGPEFIVNTYTTSRQNAPAVAADGAGNFVVVWTGYGEGDDDYPGGVFGQRFDSSGGAQGPEFLVNTYTTGRQDAPAVAADGAGNFVVVWSSHGYDYYSGDYFFGVFGQRYDSAGNAQGGEFLVNQSTIYSVGEFAPSPAVAKDAAGNFVVVWNGYGYDYFDVFGRRYDSTGTALGGEFKVNTTSISDYGSLGYPGDPAIAADASGSFVVVWENYSGASSGYRVLGRRHDSAGTALGGEFEVSSSLAFDTYADAYGAPAIASNGSGSFVVVWDTHYEQDSRGKEVLAVVVLCGDGVLDPGEQCDDTGESAECDVDCTLANCGDNAWNVTRGEECDDGNASNNDDCTDSCKNARCGDGWVWNEEAGAEECDYAGESPTCDVDCTVAECGDSTKNSTAGEQCDDGNTTPGDGCDEKCRPEAATTTTTLPPSIECGDGRLDPGEQCDDGKLEDGDCCSSTCQFESSGTVCRPAADVCDAAEVCTGFDADCPPDEFVPNGTACNDGNNCLGDTCQDGQCTGLAACSLTEVADEQIKKIKLEYSGEKGDRVVAYGLLEGLVDLQTLTRPTTDATLVLAEQSTSGEPVRITKKVRKRVKRRSGKVNIKLSLNKTGRKLLRKAHKQNQALAVTVRVESQRGGQKLALLNYVVRVVKKKQTGGL